MASSFDYKKEFKDLYLPGSRPMLLSVPRMVFVMVDGEGDPNTAESYKEALELLYGISYTVKMSKMGAPPPGYFEYVVPPLEGLWSLGKNTGYTTFQKDSFVWTALIRLPDFVTDRVFSWATETLGAKKPQLSLGRAYRKEWEEGLCTQIMHTGPYDAEPASIAALETFATENGYCFDLTEGRQHHEIYLSDPRRSAPDNLKTVIRYPVKTVD